MKQEVSNSFSPLRKQTNTFIVNTVGRKIGRREEGDLSTLPTSFSSSDEVSEAITRTRERQQTCGVDGHARDVWRR